MELTWITFPIWVVLVSAGAYALAMYTKGDELRLNQVDLVDVDVQSGIARGTSWLNLFSPQSQTFDLGLALREPSGAPVADSQRLLSWLGTGGSKFGSGSGALFAGQYDFSPELDTLEHVPVQGLVDERLPSAARTFLPRDARGESRPGGRWRARGDDPQRVEGRAFAMHVAVGKLGLFAR